MFGKEADELRRIALGLLNESRRIVLNLGSVEYLDSMGLETLIALFISARNRKAEIKFASIPPGVLRVMTITHLDQLFEVHDSTENAVRSFYPPEAAAV